MVQPMNQQYSITFQTNGTPCYLFVAANDQETNEIASTKLREHYVTAGTSRIHDRKPLGETRNIGSMDAK
jgi:hypothetical protein